MTNVTATQTEALAISGGVDLLVKP